jgi:hypothetical protein
LERGYNSRLIRRGMRNRAQYFREYRKRRGESLRKYKRDNSRAHYVPKIRTTTPTYNVLYHRALYHGPEALAEFKASWPRHRTKLRANWNKRLGILEQQLQAEWAGEIEKAMLDPELAMLIAEQAKDSKSFQIKYGLSYDENAPEGSRHTVYSIIDPSCF